MKIIGLLQAFSNSFLPLICLTASFSSTQTLWHHVCPCWWVVATAATLIGKATLLQRDLWLTSILSHKFMTHSISLPRQATYEQALMTNPTITLYRCKSLSPAIWLLLPDGDPAPFCDYFATTEMVSEPQEDLLDNPDLILFCDGSHKWNFQGNLITGYAHFPTWNTWGIFFAYWKISPSCWAHTPH